MSEPVPPQRVRASNHHPVADDRPYVLYWMVAQRRTRYNFGLQRAAWWARELGKPLLIFEALRAGYAHASPRFHHFILDGMVANRARLDDANVRYFAYAERAAGEGKGLLEALAARACVVISDETTCGFIPRMQAAAAEQISARLELVDANGVIPLAATQGAFKTAHAFRRMIQKRGAEHLADLPLADPLAKLDRARKARLPAGVGDRWPELTPGELNQRDFVDALDLDHAVERVIEVEGGAAAGAARLDRFLADGLSSYGESRNHPDDDGGSGLSPYLHFGHVGGHEVVARVLDHEDWSPERLADYSETKGSREGWWGTSAPAEAFLDQIVTWRELGQQFCWHRDDYLDFDSLPDWALTTLDAHRQDERPELYELSTLERAQTGDEIWNAAQRQLVATGAMHNYLRMLWGKKLLEWSATPEQALERMILLNDKYALDGRDPNSYSGIFWVLGRFDRAWGPERPIFGKVRYMSSASTRRKLRLRAYLERWSGSGTSASA